MRVLLVEDEADLARGIARGLTDARCAVDIAVDGEDGLARATDGPYDAIVLDLMLPKISGWAVLDALRQRGSRTPVLILTARDAVDDRVRGLNQGADDYLTKPFALEELIARLRALVRRAADHPAPDVRIGRIRLDLAARRVYRGDAEIVVTAREFDILAYLARQRGHVVSRTAISEHLYNEDGEVLSNAIDVHVASLRRKLGPDVIRTRRGMGYLIDR
jgi:two-component system OmpR family response regulator